mgnify:CR=1 FL=1
MDVGPEHQFTANGISVSNCYATAGNYPSPHVQAAEIIRHWWCKSMIHGTPNRTQEWVDTVVRSMQLLKYPYYRSGIMPVRIHSSGDFFSPAYALAWVQVANSIWALDKRIVPMIPTEPLLDQVAVTYGFLSTDKQVSFRLGLIDAILNSNSSPKSIKKSIKDSRKLGHLMGLRIPNKNI